MNFCVEKSWRNRAWCVGIVAAAFLACATTSNATAIAIDLGPPPKITQQAQGLFNDLNGTALAGQTLSLDFIFTNGNFARLFTVTTDTFASRITLQTNGIGVVGFLSGTGYLLDQQGNPLTPPTDLGSASGSDGSLDAGLFPLLSGALAKPLDFFGVHYDLTLPTNLIVSLTSGQFELVAAGASKSDRFGIGPGVPSDIIPEFGGTILLFIIGLTFLTICGKPAGWPESAFGKRPLR
jgi:hypothetical protein